VTPERSGGPSERAREAARRLRRVWAQAVSESGGRPDHEAAIFDSYFGRHGRAGWEAVAAHVDTLIAAALTAYAEPLRAENERLRGAVDAETEACARIAEGRMEALSEVACVVNGHEDTEHLIRDVNRSMSTCFRIAQAIRHRVVARREAAAP
jgi:hypothetical protein